MNATLCTLIAVSSIASNLPAQDTIRQNIEIRPHPSIPLAFDKTEITAKAGTRISLTLNNTNPAIKQPYNLVLIKPGKTEDIGALATAMITDPKALEKHYIPDQKADIIANTPIVEAGESATIEVTLPEKPGDYPYLCTLPGHWLQMRGILRITP
jgi:azurin